MQFYYADGASAVLWFNDDLDRFLCTLTYPSGRVVEFFITEEQYSQIVTKLSAPPFSDYAVDSDFVFV